MKLSLLASVALVSSLCANGFIVTGFHATSRIGLLKTTGIQNPSLSPRDNVSLFMAEDEAKSAEDSKGLVSADGTYYDDEVSGHCRVANTSNAMILIINRLNRPKSQLESLIL